MAVRSLGGAGAGEGRGGLPGDALGLLGRPAVRVHQDAGRAVDGKAGDGPGDLAVVPFDGLVLGGAALDAPDKPQRRHGGGVVRLLLGAAVCAANPTAGVQVARGGVQRHDEARQVRRPLVGMKAQVGDVLAAILGHQPAGRAVKPLLLLLRGGLGPPFRGGGQQDFKGHHRVGPAAFPPLLVHGVGGGQDGGNIGGGVIGADEHAVEVGPARICVRGRGGAGHVVGGGGDGAGVLVLGVAVDGEGGHRPASFLSG